MLYPLKFKPIFKERVWGGQKLKDLYGKKYPKISTLYGESWELSAVEGSESIVANGMLKGNSLSELAEVYMGDLLGEKVFKRFGTKFPLLVKLIDAAETLSIQVHPNDHLALERHGTNGKSEMWYVLHAESKAQIMSGLKQEVTRSQLEKIIQSNTIADIIKSEDVKANDFFYIPAGTIHAIGKGVVLLEIQQTSDITYRLFDWNRTDAHGEKRELHKELAIDAIDIEAKITGKQHLPLNTNDKQLLVNCPYFRVNRWYIDKETEFDHFASDSFVILICIDGKVKISSQSFESIEIEPGELVLVPAEINLFSLMPNGSATLLEVYIEEDEMV
jgi:mannose-6-phosphate isomerase